MPMMYDLIAVWKMSGFSLASGITICIARAYFERFERKFIPYCLESPRCSFCSLSRSALIQKLKTIIPTTLQSSWVLAILKEQPDRNTVADVLRGGRLPRCGTTPGALSKLRLGGDFPRLNISERSGKCQAAHDAAPSAAIRSPPYR